MQIKTNTTRDWVRAITLLVFGSYFAFNLMTGNIANYINIRFVWLSYVAAGLFLLFGVGSVVRILRTSDAASLYVLSSARYITWTTLLVVLTPLFFGLLIPARPLGAEAVNGGIDTRVVLGTNESSFTIAPEERNVLDWLRMFGNSTDYNEFAGQPVNTIGFVYREPDFAGDEFMMARFTVSCCVADASALGLPVVFADTSNLTDGEWVEVVGEIAVQPFGEDTMPVVDARTVTVIPPPEHPYLYP